MRQTAWTALIGVVLWTTIGCGGGDSKSPAASESDRAEAVLIRLREAGLPIGEYEVYTEETDPNDLLGRPNGYVAKANFRDTRLEVERDGEFDTEDGGSVEVYRDNGTAKQRKEYIDNIGKGMPALIEYSYVEDGVLLRVSKRLTPAQAAEYEKALRD